MKKDKTTKFVESILKLLHLKLNEKTVNLLVQIFKFVIVGGIATIIDWIIYYLFYKILNFNPLVANIFSFSVSVIYNYVASVKWVFIVNKSKTKKKMFIEFMIFSIIGFILTELLLWLFIDLINMNEMISKIVATIIVMIFNFITRKIFLEK